MAVMGFPERMKRTALSCDLQRRPLLTETLSGTVKPVREVGHEKMTTPTGRVSKRVPHSGLT